MNIKPTLHNYYGAATMYAAPSLGVAAETPPVTPMCWPSGAATGAHKFAYNVKSADSWVVQTGHKLGPLVIHLQIVPAPDNILTAVHLLLSSWEVKFQNGECTAQGSPLGSLLPILMNGVVCADPVSLPLGVSPTSVFASVWHYTSLVDLIAGWIEIYVGAAFEALGAVGGGGKVTPRQARLDALLPSGAGMARSAAGSVTSSVAGAGVRAVGREFFGYRGAIGSQVEVGLGSLGKVQVGVTQNHDGSWAASGAVGGPLGMGSAAAQYGQDAQGNDTVQTTTRTLSQSRQRTATEQRQPDGSVQTQRQTTTRDHFTGGQTQSDPTTSPGSWSTSDWL